MEHEKYWETFRKGKGEVSVRWANSSYDGVIVGAWYHGSGTCKYCGKQFKLEKTLGNHIFAKHGEVFLEEFDKDMEEVKKRNGIKNQ